MNKKILLAVAGFVLLVVYMSYLTLSAGKFRCEVCMEFQGRTECRSAIGKDQEEAQLTALSTACGLISGGVSDGINCQNTRPKSISCQKR